MTPGQRVGVFDAGIGGLPVARELIRAIPNVSICYLSDSSRRPYGPQPHADVAGYVREAEEFFVRQGVDAWVIACNTASVVAPDSADRRLPCVDMVEAIGRVLPRDSVGPIALLGTQGTVASGVIPRRYPDRTWVSIATERLLRYAEEGIADAPEVDELLTGLGTRLAEAGTGHAVLACTDYTCVLPTMTTRLPGVTLLDPLGGAVETVVDLLSPARATAVPGSHELHDTGTHPVDIGRLAERTYGFTFSTVTRHQNSRHQNPRYQMNFQPADRIHRLEGPHLRTTHGNTLRALERELEQQPAGRPFLDVTYADTHRFPPVDWALPAFSKAACGAGMTYTPYRGDAEVRADVATNIGNLIGHELDPAAEVILTPGTQAGLYCALATILNSGDKVVIPDPDYITSDRSVRYFDGEVLPVPLVWDAGRSPRLDLDVLRAQLSKKPKLVMFSHPNNPTGAVFTPEHVAEIADVVAASDALVLVDQLYCRLVYDEAPFAHFATLPGMWDRTLTTFGPSKTESLSGYRIGAAIGNPELISRMEDVMGIASLRAPAYAQHVMSRWIRDDDDYVRSRIVEYQALRDRTVVALSAMPGIDVRTSGGSAYLFPSFAGLRATDQEVALALKRDAGLVVNPGYQFGAGGDRHFRICFAQDELVWEKGLGRMASVLAGFPTAD